MLRASSNHERQQLPKDLIPESVRRAHPPRQVWVVRDRLARAIGTLTWDPVIATSTPAGYVSPDSRQEGEGSSARDL
jgi:hypothetical protein